MIEKTDAIILKSKKYRDTSKILTLFTKDHGKLNMIAKGSRAKNNKFGGSIETLSHVSIVFYNYPQKDFQYISQASINDFFHGMHDDLSKTMIGMAITEIINNTTQPNDKNLAIYNLLLETFSALNECERDPLRYFIYFQINYADLIGYSPNFHSCASCGLEVESGYKYDSIYFSLENGALFCEQCQKKIIVILRKGSPGAGLVIRRLTGIPAGEVKTIRISSSLINEVLSVYHQYLKIHVSGMKDLKALDMLFSISDD